MSSPIVWLPRSLWLSMAPSQQTCWLIAPGWWMMSSDLISTKDWSVFHGTQEFRCAGSAAMPQCTSPSRCFSSLRSVTELHYSHLNPTKLWTIFARTKRSVKSQIHQIWFWLKIKVDNNPDQMWIASLYLISTSAWVCKLMVQYLAWQIPGFPCRYGSMQWHYT